MKKKRRKKNSPVHFRLTGFPFKPNRDDATVNAKPGPNDDPAVDVNSHADRTDPGRNSQADKVLVRGNRVGRECGRSASKEASPNFRAAGLGAMCLESPRASRLSIFLAPRRGLLLSLICHLLQSRAQQAPFPRMSVPHSSLSLSVSSFHSRSPLFLSFFVGAEYRAPKTAFAEHQDFETRAFRLAVRRTPNRSCLCRRR